jgi:hypothetical protein
MTLSSKSVNCRWNNAGLNKTIVYSRRELSTAILFLSALFASVAAQLPTLNDRSAYYLVKFKCRSLVAVVHCSNLDADEFKGASTG